MQTTNPDRVLREIDEALAAHRADTEGRIGSLAVAFSHGDVGPFAPGAALPGLPHDPARQEEQAYPRDTNDAIPTWPASDVMVVYYDHAA